MDTPILYVIRHGRTSLNIENRFRGEKDVPLAPQGMKDADDIVHFFKTFGVSPSFIVSSDKKRAVQTSQKISHAFHVPIKTTQDLRAWNLGDFSGKPKNKENLKNLDQYIKNTGLTVPGGESLDDFRNRILPVLAECFEHATRNGIGFVIAHSSVVHELGNQLYGDHKSVIVKPGGIVCIGLDNGKITADRVFKPLRNEEGAASVS